MPTLEEALNGSVISESTVVGGINDRLTIDTESREIHIPESELLLGVESDEKGERKYFEIPRYVGNNLDLWELGLRVVYHNAQGQEGMYVVMDRQLEGDKIVFSWELYRSVTEYKGNVEFLVCAVKTQADGTYTNEWNTTPAIGIVKKGLEKPKSDEVDTVARDLVEQLLYIVNNSISDVELAAEQQKQSVYEQIEQKAADTLKTIPEDYSTMDRQVKRNVKDIATLDKATAIVSTLKGEVLNTNSSAAIPPKNIKLFGKTEQPSTEGNQLITYPYADSSKTLNGINFIDNGDGSITIKGTATAYCFFSMADDVALATDTYTISGYVDGVKVVVQNKNDNTYLRNTFTLAENATVGIWLDISIGVSLDVTIYPMLNQGNVAKPWEPYTGGEASPNMNYPQPLNSHGDSGSIVGKVLTGNLYDSSYRVTSESSFFSVGVSDLAENEGVYRFVAQSSSLYIWLHADKGKEYNQLNGRLTPINDKINEISVLATNTKINHILISFYDGNKVSLGYVSNTGKLNNKFTTQVFEGAKYFTVRIGIVDAVVGETYETSVMANFGQPMDYEPYTEQPFTALTPNGLPGIPLGKTIPDAIKNSPIHMSGVYWDGEQYWIGDTKNENGKDVQRIREFIPNSRHTIVDMSQYTRVMDTVANVRIHFEGAYKTFVKKPMLCNKLKVAYSWSIDEERCWLVEYHGVDINVKYERLGITSEATPAEREAAVGRWVDNNEIKVYYILAKPIITDLTKEELDQYNALLMNYPNTTVVNDAGAYMEVEYVADTKIYVDNLKNKHNEDIQALKTAIIALGGTI